MKLFVAKEYKQQSCQKRQKTELIGLACVNLIFLSALFGMTVCPAVSSNKPVVSSCLLF